WLPPKRSNGSVGSPATPFSCERARFPLRSVQVPFASSRQSPPSLPTSSRPEESSVMACSPTCGPLPPASTETSFQVFPPSVDSRTCRAPVLSTPAPPTNTVEGLTASATLAEPPSPDRKFPGFVAAFQCSPPSVLT